MKTPREILLQQHQAVVPKLDAIRARVLTGFAQPLPQETLTWRDLIRSVRWHLAAMTAACLVAFILGLDYSPGSPAKVAVAKHPTSQQIWASLRERQRLFLEYTEAPATEAVVAPGRRSEIKTNWSEA